ACKCPVIICFIYKNTAVMQVSGRLPPLADEPQHLACRDRNVGAGAEDGLDTDRLQGVMILRRDDAPADDDDVVAALGLQGLDELGYECLVAGRLRRYPDDVDVVLDGVAGRFLRGLEQRSDVDVETDVR